MTRQLDFDSVLRRYRQHLFDLVLGGRQGGRSALGERHSKNICSSPAGVTEISIFAGRSLSFLKLCGVPTGMLENVPAFATTRSPL